MASLEMHLFPSSCERSYIHITKTRAAAAAATAVTAAAATAATAAAAAWSVIIERLCSQQCSGCSSAATNSLVDSPWESFWNQKRVIGNPIRARRQQQQQQQQQQPQPENVTDSLVSLVALRALLQGTAFSVKLTQRL